MTDEPRNAAPADDVDDDMPAPGAAPCGDVFSAGETTYVTDADDVAG